MSIESGARRPIAARDLSISQHLTRWLVDHRVSADAISIAGLVFALFGGLAAVLGLEDRPWAWVAMAVFVELRLLCNMLDGMVAVAGQAASRRGELLNDFPDRLADAAILIGLGYAAGSSVELGYLAAIAAVLTAYVRVFGDSLGLPADFVGPMAKPHRMHTVAFVALLCAALIWVCHPIENIILGLGIPAMALLFIAVLTGVTICRRVTRIWRALV
jgi:phosphatidylglycerophosphate synthase